MKTKTVQTYSLEELTAAGWKGVDDNSSTALYLGQKIAPTARIKESMLHLLGRTFKVLNLEDENVVVEAHDGAQYVLRPFMLKTKVQKAKVHKKIFRDRVVSYNGYGFRFPCAMQGMSEEEAIDVAKWILKVAK